MIDWLNGSGRLPPPLLFLMASLWNTIFDRKLIRKPICKNFYKILAVNSKGKYLVCFLFYKEEILLFIFNGNYNYYFNIHTTMYKYVSLLLSIEILLKIGSTNSVGSQLSYFKFRLISIVSVTQSILVYVPFLYLYKSAFRIK